MPGPIPVVVPGRFREAIDIEVHPLRCLSEVEAALREVVEEKAWSIFRSYLQALSAAKASPREQEIRNAIEERHNDMRTVIALLVDPMPRLKMDGSRPQELIMQFHSALATLLVEQGSTLHKLRRAAENALLAVRKFDFQLTTLLAAAEKGLEGGIFEKISGKTLREVLIFSLYRLLESKLGETDTGSKGMLVALVSRSPRCALSSCSRRTAQLTALCWT